MSKSFSILQSAYIMFTIGKIIIIIIIVHLGEREGPCVLSTPAKVKPCPLSMGSSRSTPSQATRIGPKFYQHHENLALEISTSLSLESRQKLALFKVTLIATEITIAHLGTQNNFHKETSVSKSPPGFTISLGSWPLMDHLLSTSLSPVNSPRCFWTAFKHRFRGKGNKNVP